MKKVTEEKYKSGNYCVAFKQKENDNWSKCYRPNDLTWRRDFDYKLIHKKHEDILNAYLENNSVEIEELISKKPSEYWQNIQDGYNGVGKSFIDLYDETMEYRMSNKKNKNLEEEMKDSFNKFGFETPNFKGEILKEVDGYYIGYFYDLKKIPVPCHWDSDGICSIKATFNRYDLTPLKVNWWEKEENIGKMVYDMEAEQFVRFFEFKKIGNLLKVGFNENVNYHENVENIRPLTREECLSLCMQGTDILTNKK